MSEEYRSTFPAVHYEKAFAEDLRFPTGLCYRAIVGEVDVNGFSAQFIISQCQSNLDRLDKIRGYIADYQTEACSKRKSVLQYFTPEATAILCGGYLTEDLSVEIDERYSEFLDYKRLLFNFVEKCRRRTGDAYGC